ncbi:hypothetical protein ABIE67_009952 [Streptomyces sp. V4I8]
MTETELSEAAVGKQLPQEQVEAVLEQLMDSADATGARLAGEGGLLQQLSKGHYQVGGRGAMILVGIVVGGAWPWSLKRRRTGGSGSRRR